MNKRNNKGFTLIEVLATIAIIAVVTLIATVTYTKVRRNIVNRQYKNLKSIIEIAGVRYTSKTGKTMYHVLELIEEGYLEPDDETGNIYDPRDGHSLNCHLVKVDIENTNYTATLGDINYKDKDGCKVNTPTPDPIPSMSLKAYIHGKDKNYKTAADDFNKLLSKDDKDIYKNIDIVVSDGLRWTNKQLDLTAELDANLPYYVDITGVRYIWNNEPSSITGINTHTTNVEVTYNNPYTVEAVMKNNQRYKADVHYSFDVKPPEIKKGSPSYLNNDKDTWKQFKYITFEITENEVGLHRIYIGKRPCSDLKKDSKLGVKVGNPHTHVQTYKVEIESGVDGEDGQVNVCGIDLLGNVSKGESFKIIKVDITPPHCKKELKANRSQDVIGEHNKYQYASRTIRQYCYDNNMSNGTLVIGSQCDASYTGGHTSGSNVYFEKTFNPNVGTAIKAGYITIKDKAGWTTKCSVNVYVDRKGPLCAKRVGNTQSEKDNGTSTTVGVGSTNNWDQLYRHITQHCYDEHVGCLHATEEDTWTNHDSRYTDPRVIRTSTITISDKVPYCSRKETVTSSNCSGNDWNSSYNNTHYYNKTSCTEGVYIDSIPPKATQQGYGVHGGNRIKVDCDDPKSNTGVIGSGVKTFTATASTGGGACAQINPCHSPSDCSTSYSTTQNNYTGNTIQFKIKFVTDTIAHPADDITVRTTCIDNANNIDRDDDNNPYRDLKFNANMDDSTSFGKKYINEIEGRENLGPSNGCILKQYRETSETRCVSTYSYDCARQDFPCATENNAGMGSTCCLQGESPIYGCKSKSGWKSFGETNYVRNEKYGSSNEWYMEYNDGSGSALYVIPNLNDPNRDNCEELDGVLYCNGGYKCLHFKCYPDNPNASNSQGGMYTWVCGNKNK